MLVADTRVESRWPQFGPLAVEAGAGSMLCTPLAVQDNVYGSLSLVSSVPDAFDEEAQTLAAVFAAHATLALLSVSEVRNLRSMADSRDLIGQAKGILMERFRLTSAEAFSTLVRTSQHHNVKLRTLCQQLADTGELPDVPAR